MLLANVLVVNFFSPDVINLHKQSGHSLDMNLNDTDRKYKTLNCNITPVDKSSEKYKQLEQFATESGSNAQVDESNRYFWHTWRGSTQK